MGWHWAMEIARLGHEIWVLTRANNRPVIEEEFSQKWPPTNLHFLYYDLPAWVLRWKSGGRGVHLYYLLWQWGAYLLAKKKHAEMHFDLVHHITFVSVRQPSFMGNLGIPFIFGPVAGGERAPWRLRIGYGARGFLLDALRDLANLLVKIDPLMRRTFKQATRIYVTSEQTRALLPRKYQRKACAQLAIGIDDESLSRAARAGRDRSVSNGKPFRILYVGHFLYLKGMHLGLCSFARLIAMGVDARLTMVGKGPDEKRWRGLSKKLGVSGLIDWVPWVSQEQLSAIYNRHDVFFFPSLHDSGGMVVLEALAHGLPVVCFDLGGPGAIVNECCGEVVLSANQNEGEVVGGLSKALIAFASDNAIRRRCSEGAFVRAGDFCWSTVVGSVATDWDQYMSKRRG